MLHTLKMDVRRTLLLAIASLFVGGTVSWGTRANAHSWYPKECCSNDDCMPVENIETDARGDTIVIVGHHRIKIPRSLRVRSSPDGRSHICFRVVTEPEVDSFTMPLCLFQPALSW